MVLSNKFENMDEAQLQSIDGGVDPATACVVLACILFFLIGCVNGCESTR